MKNPRSFFRSFWFVALILALLGACSTSNRPSVNQETSNTNRVDWRSIKTNQIESLVVAVGTGRNSFRKHITINDPQFVRSIFDQLKNQDPGDGKFRFLIAGRLMVFCATDKTNNIAFLYWPAGTPPHLFAPVRVRNEGEEYRVLNTAFEEKFLSISDFDKRIKPFFDVWD